MIIEEPRARRHNKTVETLVLAITIAESRRKLDTVAINIAVV